ncbi:ribosomal protein L15 [Heterostelium album PN500]|uniref:Ribosomal protein L15 n=1 Tax=Heterostelium pallidum (strain ATCC 26659 / Pp 5 / PN500) TaxID=670386 RepID=D3BGQ4_HETP5|nr:ribosomal protein L15 [Heterostelium album PN500]EFA79288.1 ribosomal protein L15 [Heterostelium album PN500]|eukprot:XP_020431409.1 ribosomal protein L15 [Heterostelium album PN500]
MSLSSRFGSMCISSTSKSLISSSTTGIRSFQYINKYAGVASSSSSCLFNTSFSVNNNNSSNNIDTTFKRTIISLPHEISLNNLRDNPGANKKKIRLGRGIGSGKGKTSGRGHGGQKARAGHNIPRGFEGGQTPLFKRMRKYGFSNARFARVLNPLNLDRLSRLIDDGLINPNETITMKHLYDVNAVGKIKFGIKLLASGEETFKHKINIELSDFSENARKTIESLGGSASNVYYDRVGLRFLLKPEKFDFTPKRARVPLKLKEKYPNHPTGYLGAYSTDGSPPAPKESTTESA